MRKHLGKVWTTPVYFVAFGFGSGLITNAPGTWGTLAAIPLYLLLLNIPSSLYFLITVLLFMLGTVVSEKVTNDLGVEDYKGIVIDEIVGFLLVMFLVPFSLSSLFLGFILFRIFDIWKPWPIGWLDTKIKGGLGIMVDDVVAAIYASVLLHLIIWAFKI
ncbi:MAG: phosphatidylglycerophosphatase [Legionellales bacterium RIFCSPHIGHO2_12_FULL_35_11]|nr:MAG: phosphatidylglycerophosphatase [Legionellales bacterium RIFCSPHIGHO2_12_FULL_35_11]